MDLQTQCNNSPTEDDESNKKPYRSELNLVLSYPGQPTENDSQGSSDTSNLQSTPPVPAPMELLTPSSQTNALLLQNFPPPNFPSSIPSSPLTPPMNFKTVDGNLFEKVPDYTHINFVPINTPVPPLFSSDNSIFCTVSAPSTPASDRKCIDKFCVSESNSDNQRSTDKKKAKRVSIFNSKEDGSEKVSTSQEVNTKDGEGKEQGQDANNPNHHSHAHRHSHGHIHPKRRMSLDNNLVSRMFKKMSLTFIETKLFRIQRGTKIIDRFVMTQAQKSRGVNRTGLQTPSRKDPDQTVHLGYMEMAIKVELQCPNDTVIALRRRESHHQVCRESVESQ